MILSRLLYRVENFLFNSLKIILTIFGVEQSYSSTKGNHLINSEAAYELYHNDLTPELQKKKFAFAESLWVFILVISFLKFVI